MVSLNAVVLIWGCTRAVLGYLFWNNVSIVLELFQTILQRNRGQTVDSDG